MIEHKKDLSDFSGKELTDEKIEEHFQVDVINDEVIDIFEKVYKDLTKTEKLVLNVYSKATSNTTKTIIITAAAVLAAAIVLLNLPITKSFGKLGVSILISGIVLAAVYAGLLIFKDKVTDLLKINLDLSSIKFNMFLIWGIAQIAIGTVLIVLKKLLFKKVA